MLAQQTRSHGRGLNTGSDLVYGHTLYFQFPFHDDCVLFILDLKFSTFYLTRNTVLNKRARKRP